jgi:hypothetical protein
VGTYLCIDQPSGFSDVISRNDFLSAEITVDEGNIRLPSGRTYPLLLITDSLMLPAMARKIKSLVSQGAVVAGPRPVRAPGLQDYPVCDSVVSAIGRELWTSAPSYGPSGGMVFNGLTPALEYLKRKPGALYEPAQAPDHIALVHRRSADVDIFFLVNRDSTARYFEAIFPVRGKQPELWQAEDGSVADAMVWEEKGATTRLELFLHAGQSVFVVFRRPAIRSEHIRSINRSDSLREIFLCEGTREESLIWSSTSGSAVITLSSGRLQQCTWPVPAEHKLNDSWKVDFLPVADTSFSLVFNRLTDFRDHSRKEVNYFSGTAVYRNEFRLDSAFIADREKIILDMGSLNDIVAVNVNGTSAGVVWHPPWRLEITSVVHPGVNNLEIAVTTNWANRMIGDEQEPADFLRGNDRGPDFGLPMAAWPDWFIRREPRPSAGRKSFSNWYYYRSDSKLQPAGLTGPVRILSLMPATLLHFDK